MLLRGEKVKCKVVTLKFGEKRWECLDEGSPDPVKGARNQIRRRAKTKTEAKQKVQNEIRKRLKCLIQAHSQGSD